MVKQCTKCKEEKSLTATFFPKSKQAKDGFQSWCRKCKYKVDKKYKKKNPNKTRKWNLDNPIKNHLHNTKYQNSWGKGVYAIFEDGICLWVGESKALRRRIGEHKSSIKNPSANKYKQELYEALHQHKNLVIGIIENCDNHKEREQYWINKLKPLYNAR